MIQSASWVAGLLIGMVAGFGVCLGGFVALVGAAVLALLVKRGRGLAFVGGLLLGAGTAFAILLVAATTNDQRGIPVDPTPWLPVVAVPLIGGVLASTWARRSDARQRGEDPASTGRREVH